MAPIGGMDLVALNMHTEP